MDDLDQIDRVTVQPGDRFVVRVPGKYTHSAHDNIRAHVAFGLGVDVDHVLVLEDDMTLAAVSTLDERRVPDLLDANNRYHDRNVALSSGLLAAVQQFRFYERQHRAKGTPDADRKADVNQMMAHRLEGIVLARGTVPSAWFAFASAHQIALNFKGVLDSVMVLHDVTTSDAHEDLRETWTQQLDALGAMALEEAPEGALTITLAQDDELPKPYKATAQTEAGSIAAGGSALVAAFVHHHGGEGAAMAPQAREMIEAFTAFAVDQLKARTLGADFQIVDAPKPSDGVAVVHVDFAKGGGVEGIKGLAPVSCPDCGRNLYTAAECCPKCPDGGVL